MQKEILQHVLAQNKKDCAHFCKNITAENINFRLSEQTASVGFIYRHIGETTNLIGQFFGYNTDVEAVTIGQIDVGDIYDLEESRRLFDSGYNTLEKLIADTPDIDWLEEIATAWFGKILRINLLSILLNHNAHHCGQISSAILKGKRYFSQTFYHGTKANLKTGDLIDTGYNSNYGKLNKARYVYLSATLEAATWGAELAKGEGDGKIYIVEATGSFEDDPNLTNKKFPGNPTRSYRTKSPLKVIGEVTHWVGHSAEQLKTMYDHLERLKEQGIEAIED